MNRVMRIVLAGLCAFFIAGCGGGGAGGGDKPSVVNNDTTEKTLELSLRLLDANGQPVVRLKEDQVFDLTANVVSITRKLRAGVLVPGSEVRAPASGEIVTFVVGGGALSVATALSDTSGVAKVKFTAGDDAGAFQLKATVGASVATYNIAVQEVLKPTLKIELLEETGGTLVTTLQGGRIYRVRATAQRVESTQSLLKSLDPLADAIRPNAIVTTSKLVVAPGVDIVFSTDGGEFDPASGKGRTDAAGVAEVKFRANVIRDSYIMVASGRFDNVDVVGEQAYSIDVASFSLGAGVPFAPRTLDIETPIPAGGSSLVKVQLREANGSLVQRPTQVTFTSGCVAAGSATIISPVTSSNGVAQTTFRARPGCVGNDQIRASAVIPGLALEATATGTVTVLAPVASGVEFVSAVPTVIVLAGRGSSTRPEISNVKFRVKSLSGIPVPGQLVEFRLTTSAARLLAPSGITDTNGEVIAQVQSGTAASVFRVIASFNGVSTQSDQIAVSTGSADQQATSLSVSALNVEAFNVDGVPLNFNIQLSDLNRNPIADGTSVLFTAEGGQINPTCITAGGGCTVVWRSSNPRPANGRITVLARTIGDESFVDLNGNGQFNDGEPFTDLPEAFRDDNENDVFNPGEFFSDVNGNGVYDNGNGVYDGLLCAATRCGQTSSIEVRDSIVIVISTGRAVVSVSPDPITVNEVSAENVRISVSDTNGNQMAPGTKVEITNTNGVLSGETVYTIGDSNGPGPFVAIVQIRGDGTRSVGLVIAKVTSPAGQTSIGQARVEDTSICDQNFAPLPPGCGGAGGAGASQIGSITALPSALLVRPGMTVNQTITLEVRDSSTRNLPYTNVVPSARCAALPGQSGYVVNVLPPIPPTDLSGVTVARLEIQSSAIIAGAYTCTFTAGTKTATVNFSP